MESKFVFDLGATDLSEGQSDLAALAGDDAPLSLETAIWSPELAGPLGFPAWTVLDLRGAIRRGDLRPERHGHKIVVTRRQLREWRERCRAPEKPETETPCSRSTTSGASGSSDIGRPRASAKSADLSAALAIAARLTASSPNSSSKRTGRGKSAS